MSNLSRLKKEYLMLVYQLSQNENPVEILAPATAMQMSGEDAQRTASWLVEKGFLTRTANDQVILTPKGAQSVMEMNARKDMVLLFLAELLRMEDDLSEEETVKFHQLMNSQSICAMEQLLNQQTEAVLV